MATAASTLLTEVDAAISACLSAQSYTVRGRGVARAQLGELRKMRSELIAEINEAGNNSGSMATVGQIRGPS